MKPRMSQHESTGNPVEIFQNSWNLYRKIVGHDYMFHQAIYAELGRFLMQHQETGPMAFVELGCGDASQTAAMLSRCNLASYYGVDLSEAALSLATENLAALPCPVRLELADMVHGLSRIESGVEVIFCGFALHHLGLEEKSQFFTLSRRKLKPGGVLLLTDVVRDPGQDRSAYLEAYLGYARERWQALNPDEFALLCEHVRSYDFPESTEALIFMAKEAGFPVARQLSRYTWHQTWVFGSDP